MKPITGTVVSSKPLPLSQAALVLSKFLEMNTGADREMLVYLRRSFEAFDELVDFHRDKKAGGVDGDGTKRKKIEKRDEQEEEERSDGGVVQRRDLVEGEGKKKKSTKEKKLTEEENDTNDGLSAVDEEKAERKKKRNKIKDGDDGGKEHLSNKEGEHTEEYRGENGFGEIEVDKKEKKKKKKRKHVEDEGVVEGVWRWKVFARHIQMITACNRILLKAVNVLHGLIQI